MNDLVLEGQVHGDGLDGLRSDGPLREGELYAELLPEDSRELPLLHETELQKLRAQLQPALILHPQGHGELDLVDEARFHQDVSQLLLHACQFLGKGKNLFCTIPYAFSKDKDAFPGKPVNRKRGRTGLQPEVNSCFSFVII
jgi:hypothetical protein